MSQQLPQPSLTTLSVQGMSCQHCVAAVSKALQAVPGVQSARVDLASASAQVEGSAPAGALVDAVVAAGYEAQVNA